MLAVLLCVALLPCAALAANQVPQMELDVALLPDGSAQITQIWTSSTDEGTEFYLSCRDNGYLSITDFSVSDQNGPYTFVEDWDLAASFEEKTRKCGLVTTDEGVELCWGISEYGENRYTLQYVLHDLVGSYQDADGFNYRFVDEMGTFPTHVTLTLRQLDGTPLSDEQCAVWAFGFDGQVVFDAGVIRAWSEAPLQSGQHMTVMVALEQGLLSPRRTVEGSFETVKERAFDGSDYEDDLSLGELLLILAVLAALVAVMILIVLLAVKLRKVKLARRVKRTPYFRDAPNGGNLNVSHRLGRCSALCGEDALLGAYLLRLVSQGCLDSLDVPDKDKAVWLRLCHAPTSENEYDHTLYDVLRQAAGADGILQPKELEQFCQRDDSPLRAFFAACKRNALQTLIANRCIKGAHLESLRDLTVTGQRELDELLGLKHFLLDFSLLQERGLRDTVLWQDYMVYALLLGIAEQLTTQLRTLYPESLPQLAQYERYLRDTRYYNHLMYSAYHREQLRREAARSAGNGGHASFGGGGGFSGGGGGGTR